MLFLNSAIIIVLYIEGACHSWFFGTYISVSVLLLVFSYVGNNSVD